MKLTCWIGRCDGHSLGHHRYAPHVLIDSLALVLRGLRDNNVQRRSNVVVVFVLDVGHVRGDVWIAICYLSK